MFRASSSAIRCWQQRPAHLLRVHVAVIIPKQHLTTRAPKLLPHPCTLPIQRSPRSWPNLIPPSQRQLFHSTPVPKKSLLTTGIIYGIFYGLRTITTALPMLWKWNFFKRYPRIMWTIATLPVVGTVFVIAYSYEVHPLTHRGRLMFVDEATELEVANENYATLLKEFGPKLLPVEHPDYQLTAKIALDIISVVGPELRDWDLHVVDDDSVVNAFVIASGKIFVFTGIIRMCRSPDALAAIMAHEVSHVLSRHIGEKMGIAHVFQLFTDLFHSILYTYTLNLPMIADITGRTVDVISPYFTDQPYSRMCESEADLIGLFMMSLAGYNPREAVKFWQVLADAERENEDAVPEFMSDHPSHERRAEELSEHMEMALEIYNARARLVDALSEAVRSGKGEEDPRVKRLERDMWSKFETAMAVNPA